MEMSTLLLPDVVPETDANMMNFMKGRRFNRAQKLKGFQLQGGEFAPTLHLDPAGLPDPAMDSGSAVCVHPTF